MSIVLLATLSLGWFIMLPTDFAALGKQTVAAAAFAANILNYAQAGYFDAPAIDKPLLHIWSLGVEEQFYFVFPALLLLAWRYKALKPDSGAVWNSIVCAEHRSGSQLSVFYVLPSFHKVLGIHSGGIARPHRFTKSQSRPAGAFGAI